MKRKERIARGRALLSAGVEFDHALQLGVAAEKTPSPPGPRGTGQAATAGDKDMGPGERR